MAKKKNIRQQLRNELHKQFKAARGSSRHNDKESQGFAIHEKIYSRNSLKTHLSRIEQFSKWLKDNHPEIQNLNDISRDVTGEYLRFQEDSGKSAWTTSADALAINHVMVGSGIWNEGVKKSDFGLQQRRLQDIQNNRGETKWGESGRGKEETYSAPVEYGRAFGLRRSELVGNNSQHAKASKASLYRTPDGRIHNATIGKGGRYRTSECLSSYKPYIEREYGADIKDVERLPSKEEFLQRYEGSAPLFDSISRSVRIHHDCRQFYADQKLEELRNEGRLGSGETFRCNQVILDKGQALFVSRQLGHNRLDVLRHYVGHE